MEADFRKQLQRLAKRQYRRIWVDRLFARMPLFYVWSAGILFIGGSIHQWILAVNPLLVVCIALLPSLLILSWFSLSIKPTAAEGAASADRLFEANSLFVSAWELSHASSAVKGIGGLLLARTETALPDWRQRISKQPQHYLKPASLTAMALGFAGLFFLLLPPHVQTVKAPALALSSHIKLENQDNEPARILKELFKQPEKITTGATDLPLKKVHKPGSSTTITSPKPEQVFSEKITRDAPQTDRTATPQVQGKTSAAGVLPNSTPNEGKKIAQQTAGKEAAKRSDTMTSRAKKFDRIDPINIETGADKQPTAFDAGRQGFQLIISKLAQPTFHQPTAQNSRMSQTDSASQLSAEQRMRVWRYFKQLENINEQYQ